MSKPGIVQCALKLAGIIVALSIACSIRPAHAFVVFSDLIVFTTPNVNLTGMTAAEFAAAQGRFGADILHTFAIAEREVIGPPSFVIDIDHLLTENDALPPGVPLPGLHDPFTLLPPVPVGTPSHRIAIAEDSNVLSDILTIKVLEDHTAEYTFWSDKEGAAGVPRVPGESTLLETPNRFQSLVPQLFPPPLVIPYNVFIMSDCGSPDDVCAVDTAAIPEPGTWLMLATGLVALLRTRYGRIISASRPQPDLSHGSKRSPVPPPPRSSPARAAIIVFGFLSLGATVPAAVAADVDVHEPDDMFGHLNQNTVPDCKDAQGNSFSCGPVSAVNSFVYLQNQYPTVYPKGLLDGTMQATAHELCTDTNCRAAAGGTTVPNFVTGNEAYLRRNAPNTTTVISRQTPSVDFLIEQLRTHEDVELFLTVESSTANKTARHFVTLTGIKTDPADPAPSGTLTYIDPLGGGQGQVSFTTDGTSPTIRISDYTDPTTNIKFDAGTVSDAIAESPVQHPVNPNAGIGPAGGDHHSPLMNFDEATGTLSFTDGTINFLNLVGDSSNNPGFAGDPLQGATIHIGNFILSGTQGAGYMFMGGSLTLAKGTEVFLDAQIPELLLDDSAAARFGSNVFAPLVIDHIDTAASPFLTAYENFFLSDGFPQELLGSTASPVTIFIDNFQSFSTSIDISVTSSYEVPEAPSFWLFAAGLVGLLGLRTGRPRSVLHKRR